MKQPQSSPQAVHQFSDPIEQRLKMYALAAGAAVAGLALSADAKIVYTPANQPITNGFTLDLNRDGAVDFEFLVLDTISRRGYSWSSSRWLNVRAYPQPNQIWKSQGLSPSALPTRVLLGSNAGRFRSPGYYGMEMARRKKVCNHLISQTSSPWTCKTWIRGGPWANVADRYLGLKFQIKGKTHYGWARLTVDWIKLSATLTGYAYETVADKPILIGNGPVGRADTRAATTMTSVVPMAQPGRLGSLALGTAVREGCPATIHAGKALPVPLH